MKTSGKKKRKQSLQQRKEDPNSKYWRKKADTLFSKIIRKSGRCAICGKTTDLDCAHIIPRQNLSTRWEIDNAICLCKLHHKWDRKASFHFNPASFFVWFSREFPDRWSRLTILLQLETKETAREAYERLLRGDYVAL